MSPSIQPPVYPGDTQKNAPLLPSSVAAPAPAHWSAFTRFGFRAALLYFFTFLFCAGNGTLFSTFSDIPGLGKVVESLETGLDWPLNQVAEWAAAHLFHITGIGAKFHETGSGDTAAQWVLQLVFLVFSLVGAALWTAMAAARRNPRREYQTLYAWLRFLLRLTTGMHMLRYGFVKLFPLQMAPLSLAILNEPVGQSSPMTLLWSLIGLNPVYEMICGGAEVCGGLLLLFRRTALAGALLSAFVMVNVLLYNLFFDVPVKLFAANLLLALLFIMLPDMGPLYSFFWLHKPAAPVGVWVPSSTRPGFRIATRTVEIVFLVAFLVSNVYEEARNWRKHHDNAQAEAPLLGIWKLDAADKPTGPFQSAEGEPITEFTIDGKGRAFRRSTNGALWRTGVHLDAKAHTLAVYAEAGETAVYGWQMPDSAHLVLTPVLPKTDGKAAPMPATTETFTRIPTPAHYPLLDRGFHLVNEWGLER